MPTRAVYMQIIERAYAREKDRVSEEYQRGLQQILKGSQSSSRAQFFYVAKPTEEGTKRGGCQVVKGAGLRTLWCFDLRSKPLLLSFFEIYCFTYAAYE